MVGRSFGDWLGLDGRTAVVTGAGGGIGRGVALELARVGVQVLVLDLNADGARETAELIAQETGVKSVGHGCDTSDPQQVATAARRLREELGPADVLVNNAGIMGSPAPLAELPLQDWQRVLDVNLTGYLVCAQEFGADMLQRGSGSIVHVSSITSVNPTPGLGGYSSSKAAVTMLARQLAVEWAPSGVRSNVVAPGLIRTPMTEVTYVNETTKSAREQTVPIGRIGAPEDIANAVLWFASPRSSYVTGQQIIVDGGLDQALMTMVRSVGL